jgi:hypothetical protein
MSHTDTQTSTGPCTEAGKAVSSRNAVKHNLCSTRLTGADLEQLNAIRARLDSDWPPSTETERMLLDQMALSQWRIDRALSLELAAFDDTHIDRAMLALAIRYRTTAERSLFAKKPYAKKKRQKPPSTRRWNASASPPSPEPASSFRRTRPPPRRRALSPTPMPSEPSSTPKFANSKPAHRKMNISFNAIPQPIRTSIWHIVCS